MLEYVAWPERLFVVGEDGRFLYVGGFGPEGYDVLSLEKFLAARFPDAPATAGKPVKELIADVVNPASKM